MKSEPYVRLAAMAALSFAAMYGLMYAMVDSARNVQPSLNQVYMAGLMTAPMVLIELALMKSMYPRRNWNACIALLSVALLVALWLGIRNQAAIGDAQFLKSMIPHHSGAILMCREAPVGDAEIQRLCGEIIEGQQREIDQMSAMLRRLEG
jgi:uncharacterized protein (DUF305 family)